MGVLTASPLLALRIAAKLLQLAPWLLLTASMNLPTPYPTVPSLTFYGHVL